MLAGTFQQKVKKLNPYIRFIAPADQTKPIGLYLIKDTELEHVCGVDRDFVPEHMEFDKKGHISKSGWRRTLTILVDKKITNKKKAESVFNCHLMQPKYKIVREKDPIARAIEQLSKPTKIGIELKRDDLMDISKEIKKEQ